VPLAIDALAIDALAIDALAIDALGIDAPAVDASPIDAPETGELAAAAAAMAGVASSESPSSASSRVEGRTGVPLAEATGCGCAGATTDAGTRAAAAGGALLPDGGNGSPLGLPPADLAESSFRLGLAEARSSARAKSRAPVALAEVSAAPAAPWAA
jgi:hypothetical protein